VVQGKLFLFAEASFTIKKVAVSDAEGEMYDGCGPIARQEHNQSNAEKENDLYQAKEEVYPGEQEQFPACEYKDEDVQGYEELAPEIDGRHFLPVDMAKGVGEDKKGGGGV